MTQASILQELLSLLKEDSLLSGAALRKKDLEALLEAALNNLSKQEMVRTGKLRNFKRLDRLTILLKKHQNAEAVRKST
jgi:hypothetical protein